MIFALVIVFLTLFYVLLLFWFFLGLSKLASVSSSEQPTVSVIVPARNEAENIGQCLDCLLAQDYPKDRFEIIVANDASTDRTRDIVESYRDRSGDIKLRLINVDGSEAKTTAYKKFAISQAIGESTGEIILTTDADCRQTASWIQELVKRFDKDVGFVSGPVMFSGENTLFHRLQSLEFLGLITVGAGAIGNGRPIICNGANVGYRRDAFFEVEGYCGADDLASGDDELLMQKIFAHGIWRVVFCNSPAAIVQTKPLDTLKEFLNQRRRWASKSMHYRNKLLVLMLIGLYFFLLWLFIGLPIIVVKPGFLPLWLCSFSGKVLIDFLVTLRGCTLFGRSELVRYFPLTELLHVPYIVYAGLAGMFGRFEWKSRKIKR
jgi:cellulose synthase/poly-beta-1,6-N-acetylglucosamine synthase-like glycosyltransferase